MNFAPHSATRIILALFEQAMFLQIKGSKTDTFRLRTTIRISATNDNLCPVSAMMSYLRLSPLSPDLFHQTNGDFLTQHSIVNLLQVALPDINDINSHSFRIGGASAALTSGASDSVIRILGR